MSLWVLLTTAILILQTITELAHATCITTGKPGIVISSSYDCSLGFYCPNITNGDPSTLPEICTPTDSCVATRFLGGVCPAQGTYEPVPCRGGYYCPDFKTQIICPSGSFCPLGSYEPIKCEALSICPEGSYSKRYYGSIVYALLIDVLVLIAFIYFKTKEYTRRKKNESNIKKTEKKISNRKFNPPLREATKSSLQNNISKAKLELEFHNLGLTLPGGKKILSNVSGKIRPGRLVAIMGSSGAGKSTFMNVLMGRARKTEGELLVNGKVESIEKFSKIIGYVPQEDTMLRYLTVRENITYSAKIRLPSSWSSSKINQQINHTLEILELEHVQDSIIGDEMTRGISGGQRKRVNIGLELVSSPVAIFLDEPTSGLDSTGALTVCKNLKNLASCGLTVVSIIHQPRPEIFHMFDDLILLVKGGKTAYVGPRKNSIPYFKNLNYRFPTGNNPADILMDILSGSAKPVPNTEGKKNEKKNEDSDQNTEEIIGIDDESDSEEETKTSDKVEEIVDTDSKNGEIQMDATQNGEQSKIDLSVKWHDFIAQVNKGEIPDSVGHLKQEFSESLPQMDTANIDIRIDPQPLGMRPGIPVPLGDIKDKKPDPEVLKKLLHDRGANFFVQVLLAHNRAWLQLYRHPLSFAIETFVSYIAGLIIGAACLVSDGRFYSDVYVSPYAGLSSQPFEWVAPQVSLMIGLAVSLAAAPSAVKVFSEEKSVYLRETSSGHNILAYFLGKTIYCLFTIILSALHFSCIFAVVSKLPISFGIFYLLVIGMFFCMYGLSFNISMVFDRMNAPVMSLITCMILSSANGYGPTFTQVTDWHIFFLWDLSFSRWFAEGFVDTVVQQRANIYQISDASSFYGYTFGRFPVDIAVLYMFGVFFLINSFCLMVMHRK